MMAFLEQDLPHLFDDVGIDASKYDEKVDFEDPITRYSSLKGYLFNIQFLRRVFSPTFVLHGLKQTGPLEITSRWTMTMTLAFNKVNPLRALWDPTLTFTGTSVMAINPETGRFFRHVDTWDAVQGSQAYFSAEAFAHLLSQVADLKRTPRELETPPTTILLKRRQYEIRRYDPFLVAETGGTDTTAGGAPSSAAAAPGSGAGSSSGEGVMGDGAAFMELAGYLFGKNDRGEKMEMTTPVVSGPDGRMEFYIGGARDVADLPRPTSARVAVRRREGGVFAVAAFAGLAPEAEVQRQLEGLRAALAADGVRAAAGSAWALARYNEPLTAPPLRRNEVLVRLQEPFELPW